MMRKWLMIDVWGSFICRHWPAVSAAIGLGLLHSCCSLLLPLLIGEFLQLQFHQPSSRQAIGQWLGIGHAASIAHLMYWFVAAIAVRFITASLGTWLKSLLAFRFAKNIQWQHVQQQAATAAKKKNTVQQEPSALQQWMQKGILDVPVHLCYLCLLLILLHQLHQALFFTALIALLALAILVVLLTRMQQPAYVHKRNMQSRYNKLLQQKESSDLQMQQVKSWHTLFTAYATYQGWQGVQKALRQQTLYLVLLLLMLAIVTVPLLQQTESAVFILFWLLLMNGVTPIRGLLQVPAVWAKARVAMVKYQAKEKLIEEPILPAVVTL